MTAVTAPAGQKTLAELLEGGLFVDGDWVETKDQDPQGEVRLIQLADVGDGVFRNRSDRFLTMAKAKELRCTFLEPGDILVARMPEPLGRACIFPGVGQPAVTAVDVCILRPDPDRVRVEWLVKAINSPELRAAMQEFVRGTTRRRISRKNLGTLPIAALSVKEQLALADVVDRAELKRGAAARHLEQARSLIEHFRQVALAAACSGRLTADWREGRSYDSGVDLLAKLEQPDRARRKRRRSDPIIDIPPAQDLPNGWVWARLTQLAASIEYGYTASATREPVGPQMLRITDIQDESVDWASVPYCRIDADRAGKYRLVPGDLLFARTGATTGKSYLVRDETRDAVFASYLIRVRLLDGVDPEFVYAFFRSLLYWRQIIGASVGTGQPNVNGTKLANLWVPLPGEEEQAEVVRRVGDLIRLADVLSGRIERVSQHVDRASQAVLRKAFRSDLTVNGNAPELSEGSSA